MTELFETYSVIAVYSALAVYTLAFIAFTLDLAQRSAPAGQITTRSGVVASASGGRATALLERLATDAPPTGYGSGKPSLPLRLAMGFTVVAWLLHVAAAVLRGLAAERVPWANMFEFSLTATAIVVGVFLASQFWQDLRFLGVYITGFVILLLGIASVNFYVPISPLPQSLQSAWLVIHVFVASLGTGFFAIEIGRAHV